MNDGHSRCPHGETIDRTVTTDGWATPYSDQCTLCEGRPAGLEYKEAE